MNAETLDRIVDELARELTGKKFGRIFQLSLNEIAVDFRTTDRFLYIGYSPASPRIHLIRRKLKEIERGSQNPTSFAAALKKYLSGRELSSIVRLPNERVVRINFSGDGDLEGRDVSSLVVQLTGRSSNLFLLDNSETIIDRARKTEGDGQKVGDIYAPPHRAVASDTPNVPGPDDLAVQARPDESSVALDEYYSQLAEERRFDDLVDAARRKNRAVRKKLEGLQRNLEEDLARHGDPEKWKHWADLLLANVGSARREGNSIFVTDYFDDAAPEIAIEADANLAVSEAAELYYLRYTKARNAVREIGLRLEEVRTGLEAIAAAEAELELHAEKGDLTYFAPHGTSQKAQTSKKSREKAGIYESSYRKFISSDGFEILVGKKAKDNDILTLKVARSLDTWLHAADYPGSHVVIRLAGKKEVPHRTLIEAAKLAAFYSQGRSQPKAAVHYTLKKFVSKPKGWAHGQVRLASFKTILVEPEVPELQRK